MQTNAAQIHLLVNHLPVVGTLLGTLMLLSGFALKSASVRRAALGLLVFTSLTAIPAFLSGEPAEEFMEGSPGISEELMHEHEEAAEAALVVAMLTGGIAAGALLLTRRAGASETWVNRLKIASAILGLASTAAMGNAAHLGGLIHHEELRDTPTQ